MYCNNEWKLMVIEEEEDKGEKEDVVWVSRRNTWQSEIDKVEEVSNVLVAAAAGGLLILTLLSKHIVENNLLLATFPPPLPPTHSCTTLFYGGLAFDYRAKTQMLSHFEEPP